LVLPALCLTTLLVITVVKSSLALSLGLVGALSIVRFRTPIKEPEELAYIFLAIAIGLSLGADQREVAAIALVFILGVISIIDRFGEANKSNDGNLLLTIEVDNENLKSDAVLELLGNIAPNANIRRIDQNEKFFSVVALIEVGTKEDLLKLSQEFHKRFPTGRFSIIDDINA